MPKATVVFRVAIEVEATDDLMARMLDGSDAGMGPFYPSDSRAEAWEKLARWCGLDSWNASQLDGIADFPDSAVSARRLWVEDDEVEEQS
jgi:hypothetical protein